jgi:CheY-like chemotaxis protein
MGAVRKVLIVADDPGLGRDLEAAFGREGFSAVAMADSAQALKSAVTEGYDLVCVDMDRMPGGQRFAAEFKALWPWTPVVVIAGAGDEVAGGGMVLHKPLTAETLAGEVRRIIQSAPGLADHVETAPSAKAGGGIGALALSAFAAIASAVALPFVLLTGVAWIVAQRAAADDKTAFGETAAVRILLFFASPFVALLYMGLMPMIGMRELVRLGAAAEAGAGHPPGKGLGGLVRHLFVGGRVWIADAR